MNRSMFVVATLGAIAVAVLVTGCSTFNRALSMVARESASSSENTAAAQPSAEQPPSTAQSSSASGSSAGSGYAYQMQFHAVYALAVPFGGFNTGEGGYKPGDGTVWEFTGGSGNRGASTVEHAYLKLNSDGSQWWRVELTSKKDTLLYEFLVAADGTITKVRYKDPESGKVGEFVPNQAQERQPAAGPFQPPTAAEQGTVTKNQERVTVKAGTFTAEHTSYTDSQNAYSSELWTSDEVPGRLVKYLTKNLQSGDVAEGDLVKIEHGVSTSLESY